MPLDLILSSEAFILSQSSVVTTASQLCELRVDWLDRFKPYTEVGKTIVVSPHKVWGPFTSMAPLLCVMHLKARTLAEELGILIYCAK